MVVPPTKNDMQLFRTNDYSVIDGAHVALQTLATACNTELPLVFQNQMKDIIFTATTPGTDTICFPCPLPEQDLGSALKAMEGCVAAIIADIRRLSANLYETRITGEYYHIHGSLDATTTLGMLGLPPFAPGLTDYHECIKIIETAVKKHSTAELEELNRRFRQAGIPALTRDQFLKTRHGQALANIPPFTVQTLGSSTTPQPFPCTDAPAGVRRCLTGIRVIELCRVIAGPTIGRSLAAHGAAVLKVTSPKLPDVPFFQLDVNTGKHTISLHLKDSDDRAKFEELLLSADVIIDGYRPGALASLGYSLESLAARASIHKRGIVYVAEDCFGGTRVPGADWSSRPGWQQIADCATGVAWEQGSFMGIGEPVIPPFPISDYGTGILGTVAALTGIYRRATEGGSWICRTSLSQYNLFLLSLGTLPPVVQDQLRESHDRAFFGLRHSDSVDEVGRRALRSMRRLHPALFSDDIMLSAYSPGFGGVIRWPKEPLTVSGLKIGHVRTARPNGYDSATWEEWETDEDL
ncbi:hypothetical protein TruAng_011855 [Truncatella angustata]|nr:hypothetical protein TruAng_011855 [Truncatella angustata]